LAKSLTAEPHNPELQEQLKESLEQVRRDATLVDNPEANDRAQAAIKMLNHLETAPTQEALAEIVTATEPALPAPPVVPVQTAPAAPETDEEVDAELLEIFLSEAEEVLGCVKETIPQSRSEPYNQDHLTTLRRSFHTLKGSGRMVGLMAFGEGAWSIEQVLNVRLSETRAGDADLYGLLDKATDFLGAWVNDLHTTGKSARTPNALVNAAERVKNGQAFYYESAPEPVAPAVAVEAEQEPAAQVAPAAQEAATEIATPVLALSEPVIPEITLPEIVVEPGLAATQAAEIVETQTIATGEQSPSPTESVEETQATHLADSSAVEHVADVEMQAKNAEAGEAHAHESAPHEEPVAAGADVIEFPGLSKPTMQHDDSVKHIGELEISLPLHNIYLAETDELVRLLSQDIGEWRHEPDRHVNIHVVHAAHSLAGSSATVGFKPLQEVAHALEMVLQFLARKPVRLINEEFDTLQHGIERIRFMLQMFALGEMPAHEPEQVQILERMQSEIEARLHMAPELAPLPHIVHEPLIEQPLAHIEPEHHADLTQAVPDLSFESIDLPALESPQITEEILLEMPREPVFDAVPLIEPIVDLPLAEELTHPPQSHELVHSASLEPSHESPHELHVSPATDESFTPHDRAEPQVEEIAALAPPVEDDFADLTPLADTSADQTSHALQGYVEPFSAPSFELPSAPASLHSFESVASEPAFEPAAIEPAAIEPAEEISSEAVFEPTPATEPQQFVEAAAEPVVALPVETHSEPFIETSIEPAPGPVAEEIESPLAIHAEAAQQEHAPAANFVEPVFAREEEVAVDPALLLLPKDDLDADLLPVFLEEGRDMMPQLGEQLRIWQKNTVDTAAPMSVLRLLHTLKGSARMAGAMGLGQHMHDMETRIETMTRSGAPNSTSLDDMLTRFDQGLQMFEELQDPQAAKRNAQARAAAEAQATARAEGETQPRGLVELTSIVPLQKSNVVVPKMGAANTPATKSTQAAPVPLVRVRADILDRLVNQAGEVSISRSRLETEVGTLRQSLTEMTENVARLRDQLREIEMQAETQITSRMAHSADREFDPLEFDRFTRLQELTRMMAESVNDVGSVQQNLARTVDNATTDLTIQGRLTRDLQQDLMRVRMVQFASISERLYRVTRQASKELDKRVNLDIRGSAVEIDRGVLEKMTGPFEHLLRNAIVHGIESREQRQAAGKSEIGELLVEIRQEGNEVVIQFSDDGQGLNLERIREKAFSVGLLGQGDEPTEAEMTDLIFNSGFSTADNVTELAGRGVGMDVVRSEAAGLGGRVGVVSEAGKGAHFTIHLPLTLAVTQVVILTTGGKTYAVPSVLVEQVQQLKTNPLAAAYNDGAVMWQNQRVPMHYLSALLGDKDATAVSQQYSPIMILKSGSDRVAIHVDEILGNREVVVKNIGPQLSRMIGIAGATVLGSGDIVLILNPVPLAQRYAHENLRAPRLTQSDVPDNMGAVAELAQAPAQPVKAEPVQGLRTQHIVMVVDDSLTVRRVTQRLLAREGYQVVLAKDGVDALEQLQSINPDVMLVDIEMPRMDGFDLTRNVRNDDRTRHIPIIMITSRTATKHRNYAMELGVNEYLGKPYQEDALLKSISGFVNKETQPI
jgi:chemosensory pili system protein ChpA (sensor histidine kinase/response regulator)